MDRGHQRMRKHKLPKHDQLITAIPELPYPGTTTAEWHSQKENATFLAPEQGK
jgi:hypothetical protein